MIVRYSRRKLVAPLLIASLSSLASAWALFQMFAHGNYVEPNGGSRLHDIGKIIARLTEREWQFASATFLIVLIVLVLVTAFFVFLYAKRPLILRLADGKIEIQQGWKRSLIALSSVSSAKLSEKKSQPYLELEVSGQKPVSVHLGLADNDAPTIVYEISTSMKACNAL